MEYERYLKCKFSLLECPVCLETLRPPIKQCQTGHSICSVCSKPLKECPQCKSMFLDATRNFALEQIIETICLPCPNKAEGCSFESTLKDLTAHKSQCNYVPKKCILSKFVKCEWEGTGTDKHINHIKSSHGSNLQFHQIQNYDYYSNSRYTFEAVKHQVYVTNAKFDSYPVVLILKVENEKVIFQLISLNCKVHATVKAFKLTIQHKSRDSNRDLVIQSISKDFNTETILSDKDCMSVCYPDFENQFYNPCVNRPNGFTLSCIIEVFKLNKSSRY